jgi:hypothetical protein
MKRPANHALQGRRRVAELGSLDLAQLTTGDAAMLVERPANVQLLAA